MHEVVIELERRLLPRLSDAARQIERDFAPVVARVWSSPYGTLTAYQGHVVGLEYWFPDTPADRRDNLPLEVGVRDLTTAPKLVEAHVVWGTGGTEIDPNESPTPYSPAALAFVEKRLGELISALRRGVGRGRSPR